MAKTNCCFTSAKSSFSVSLIYSRNVVIWIFKVFKIVLRIRNIWYLQTISSMLSKCATYSRLIPDSGWVEGFG